MRIVQKHLSSPDPQRLWSWLILSISPVQSQPVRSPYNPFAFSASSARGADRVSPIRATYFGQSISIA